MHNDTERGTMLDAIERAFVGCEYPEHAENQLRPILEAADNGANLTADQWATVFESLSADAAMREPPFDNIEDS